MAIKTKLLFVFFTLFLSSALLSSCYQIHEHKTEVGQRKYSEWEPKSSPRELEQCQQRCLAEERDRERQQQCQSLCVERQRERDREREREQFEEGTNSFPRDPEEEYKQCKQLCEKQEARQKSRCKRQYKEQGRGSRDDDERDPQQRYEQCRKQCERQERGKKQQQEQCKSWCEKQRRKEEGRGEKDEINPSSSNWRGTQEEELRNNPYYFHAQRFRYRLRSDAGHMRVLQRFSHKSHLLRGIDNYRLAIVEADPSTLVVPHHSDAEIILFVLRGN